MSSATVGVLLREMVELEAQGAGRFFGEPEFDIRDLLHVTTDGRGVITALELSDAQDRPALFSTFMMWMLAELYQVLPEAGDLPIRGVFGMLKGKAPRRITRSRW